VNEEPLQSKPTRQEQVFSHNMDSSSEDEALRITKPKPRFQVNINDFQLEIPKFKGRLDLTNS